MQTQYTNAPLSQAAQTIDPSLRSRSSRETDPTEQFLGLLSKLVGKVSPVGGEMVEARAAEQIVKEPEIALEERQTDERQLDERDYVEGEQKENRELKSSKEETVNPEAIALISNAAPRTAPEKIVEKVGADSGEAQLQADAQTQTVVQSQNQGKSAEFQALTQLVQQAVAVTKEVEQSAKVAQKTEAQLALKGEVQSAQPLQPLQASNAVKIEEYKPLAAKIEVQKTDDSSAPFVGNDSLMLPNLPELGEIKAPPNPVAATATSKSQTTPVPTAVPVLRNPGLDQLIAKPSILDRALEVLSKNEQPLPVGAANNEKARSLALGKETQRANPLSAKQEKIIYQIQKLLDRAAQSRDGTSITVKIEPDELGQVTVRVTQRGDQLFARVIPENKEVEQTVRSGLNELVAQLVSSGLKVENIHVSIGAETSETAVFKGNQEPLFSESNGKEGSGRHASRKTTQGGSLDAPVRGDSAGVQKQVVESGWVA